MKVFSLVLGLGMMVSINAYAQLPTTQHYGSTEYLTGGFGLEESTAIKDAMPDYTLAITLASSDGQRAAYVSGVQVVIRDNNDLTYLNVESQGPFVLAQLPAGQYQVHATYRNVTQSRNITVTAEGSTRLVFDWPRETFVKQENKTEDEATKQRPEPGYIPGVH